MLAVAVLYSSLLFTRNFTVDPVAPLPLASSMLELVNITTLPLLLAQQMLTLLLVLLKSSMLILRLPIALLMLALILTRLLLPLPAMTITERAIALRHLR